MDGTLFFEADDALTGAELWRSDGTHDGTAQVRDINPGSAGASPRELTDVDGTLYFTADEGSGGREVWRSDGSAGGTVPVTDLAIAGGEVSPCAAGSRNPSLLIRETLAHPDPHLRPCLGPAPCITRHGSGEPPLGMWFAGLR